MASSYQYQTLDDSNAGETANGCEQSGGAVAADEETELDPFTYRLDLAWYDYLKVRRPVHVIWCVSYGDTLT